MYLVPTQDGDSAVVLATVHCKLVALLELVITGADRSECSEQREIFCTLL